jgi:N-acetylmuramoyl-L-alanine amidase
MPGALSEPLFLTNPSEASAAADPATQDLLATSYAQAIEQFLRAG